MAWMPGVIVRDVGAPGRYSNGVMLSHTGVVLHVNAANSGDLFEWITSTNRNQDMSCHFQVLKDGTIYQYIDTAFSSWCQAGGNDDYLSIETSGLPNVGLAPEQFSAVASIVRWCHETHGIPLQLANSPGDAGLGWHGMGSVNWGGHPDCPGDIRRGQMPAILAAAGTSVLATSGDDFLVALTQAQQDSIAKAATVINVLSPTNFHDMYLNTAKTYKLANATAGVVTSLSATERQQLAVVQSIAAAKASA